MYLVLFDKDTLEITGYRKELEYVEAVSIDSVVYDNGTMSGIQRGFMVLEDEEASYLYDEYPELDLDKGQDREDSINDVYDLEEDDDTEEGLIGEKEPPYANLDKALAQIIQVKRRELSISCEAAIKKGFTATNGHFYEFDSKDQDNFTQQISLMSLAPELTEEIEWNTEDAGLVIHTREEFIQVCLDSEVHKRNYIAKYRALKKQIREATHWNDVIEVEWED